MKKVAIGVDIGGTNTVMGVVDESGNVLKKNTMPTETHPDYSIYMNALSAKLMIMADEIKNDHEILGIGIGAPNGNFYNGTIEFAPNLKFKGVVPVVDFIRNKFNYETILLTNDANAAAIGEMIYGGARNFKDFIMITLGTGLGSGIVVNGELVYGHDGFAGEIGHVIVDPEGRQCGCGRRGCLETYASAPGIKRTVFYLLSEMTDASILRSYSYNDLSAKKIDEAARNGDQVALAAFDFTGKMIGLKLADAIAHTSPEAIFLFGGLSQAKELIFEPVQKYMEHFLLNIYKNKVKLLPSELPPGDAAVLGSAALVWKEHKA
ncbi:MAG TPA: ROK family protein [Bacteroidales bacterium]|nr:ROK family protein [Bacteroidales bacterium]HPE55768.1 ROK family protein [Bacteroidales bacterium]HRX98321.1 ROK family protein [Bacteroidales bacterium]